MLHHICALRVWRLVCFAASLMLEGSDDSGIGLLDVVVVSQLSTRNRLQA